MSEYQYYEFAAIDRPLTAAEMTQLRKVSTRGQISASGFVNHYEWGGLKADPAEWMRRYFDAFVYTANWCSCRLSLRLPLATYREADLRSFAAGAALTIDASDEHWIIDWSLDESENYERFDMEDGSGWMGRLAPLRDELLRGDLRPLYLGWLASAGQLNDDMLEPEPPAGLSDLTLSQQALAEFIEVDPDLLAAAAAGSPRAAAEDSTHAAAIEAWLTGWSREEMAAVLRLVALGQGREAERRIRTRHATWLKEQRPTTSASAPRRSLAQLRELARSASGVRRAREAQERAVKEAESRRQREASLRLLMADVDQRWATVDALAGRGSASGYAQAVHALTDLAEGYALTSSHKEFDRAMRRLLVRHATRGALLRRLTEAGLWSG
ncbi:hypothetical protein VAR608DRAFT_0225 [Variovorax sp. HW608]|uniref:hypothetical protein n=1 Tax=Variovorax sp. HW608 TaxID=1034889 RepID=UPI00081F8927|nr:hypothetical protein [Variovorax sp. HW608]SCK08234.1 hypothetical protein VAR608DRAFT_0225 [Variovorax sp. HW608]